MTAPSLRTQFVCRLTGEYDARRVPRKLLDLGSSVASYLAIRETGSLSAQTRINALRAVDKFETAWKEAHP